MHTTRLLTLTENEFDTVKNALMRDACEAARDMLQRWNENRTPAPKREPQHYVITCDGKPVTADTLGGSPHMIMTFTTLGAAQALASALSATRDRFYFVEALP